MAEIQLIQGPEPVREAARLLRERLEIIHARRGFIRLAIPGGSALRVLSEARLDPPLKSALRLTWVDERCVPFEDPASNRGEAHRLGLLRGLSSVLPLFLDGESPDAALQRVEAALASEFLALDLLLLGLGEDGHIASLFPGHAWAPAPARVQLELQSPKPPATRISLTPSMLATAPEAILLVMGEGKREALARVMAGDPVLPVQVLNRVWIVTDLIL